MHHIIIANYSVFFESRVYCKKLRLPDARPKDRLPASRDNLKKELYFDTLKYYKKVRKEHTFQSWKQSADTPITFNGQEWFIDRF